MVRCLEIGYFCALTILFFGRLGDVGNLGVGGRAYWRGAVDVGRTFWYLQVPPFGVCVDLIGRQHRRETDGGGKE